MFAFLRTRKLKTRHKVDEANSHNKRLYTPANTNPLPKHRNSSLAGSDAPLWDAIHTRLDQAGVKPSKNAVLAQEIVLGASPEYFRPDYDRDDPNGFGQYNTDRTVKWAKDTQKWLQDKYGKDNIVQMELHLDERTPHIHAVVVPVIEKTMKKRRTKEQIRNDQPAETYTANRLDADTMFGLKEHKTLQKQYAKAVGMKPGIEKSKTKINHVDQQLYYREIGKAKAPDYSKLRYEKTTPEIRKKKLFESSQDYTQYVSSAFRKSAKKDEKTNSQTVEKLTQNNKTLCTRNRQLEEENQRYKAKMKQFAELNFNEQQFQKFLEQQEREKHQEQELKKQRRRQAKDLNKSSASITIGRDCS